MASSMGIIKTHAQFTTPFEVSPTTKPQGQVIKLDFSLPGIGSESGNLAPVHTRRDVTLFFFAPDINSSDPSTKPKAIYKTSADFDNDPTSPTLGSFINTKVDLADKVPDGHYQIVIKSRSSLPYLIKEKTTDIGGKIFEITKQYGLPVTVSAKNLITGDIYPTAKNDEKMDINDYNSLVSCFGLKAETISCQDKNAADLDDNNIVDGTDYNIMLSNFKTLLSLGFPVPSISDNIKPTPKPTLKPVTKPKVLNPTTAPKKIAKPAKKVKTLGFAGIAIPLFMLFAMIGIAVFAIKRLRTKRVAPDQVMNNKASRTTKDEVVEEKEVQIDKEFYVKQQTVDEANKTIVLTLTDDNGPTLGYYNGTEVKDGFAHVKGVQKKDGNKIFIQVSEIIPEEEEIEASA